MVATPVALALFRSSWEMLSSDEMEDAIAAQQRRRGEGDALVTRLHQRDNAPERIGAMLLRQLLNLDDDLGPSARIAVS
jgi:hypothetical protein